MMKLTIAATKAPNMTRSLVLVKATQRKNTSPYYRPFRETFMREFGVWLLVFSASQ